MMTEFFISHKITNSSSSSHISCLDRTNVAQFSAGVEALGQQLVVMGIRSSPKLDPSSIIVRMLIDMYVEIGDQIALQYGGSEAHKKVASAGTNSTVQGGPMGKVRELIANVLVHYQHPLLIILYINAPHLSTKSC